MHDDDDGPKRHHRKPLNQFFMTMSDFWCNNEYTLKTYENCH